jgi:hypothetical protein
MTIQTLTLESVEIDVHSMPDYAANPFIGLSFGPPTAQFSVHLQPHEAQQLAAMLTRAVAEFPQPVATGGDL